MLAQVNLYHSNQLPTRIINATVYMPRFASVALVRWHLTRVLGLATANNDTNNPQWCGPETLAQSHSAYCGKRGVHCHRRITWGACETVKLSKTAQCWVEGTWSHKVGTLTFF